MWTCRIFTFIPHHRQQCKEVKFVCVYPSPPPVGWTWRVYPSPPPAVWSTGCIPLLSTVWAGIHLQRSGCPSPVHSLQCSVDVQRASIYTASGVNVQGVSLSIACCVDVQRTSINTGSSVDVQGVSLSICNGNASETKTNESFDNGVFFDIEAKLIPSIVSKLFSKRSEHIR